MDNSTNTNDRNASNTLSNQEDKNKHPNADDKIEEILTKIPQEDLENLFVSASMRSIQTTSPIPPQIFDKLTGDHINKIIDSTEKSEERDFKLQKRKQNFTTLYVVLGIGVFIFLTIFLSKDKTSVFLDILKILFGFLGGLGLGTYKKYKSN
ncbi:hypothetical protein [Clostridium tyrobutyricum]|uniref:hypothetical protein n=1 Tax=Clostridium tyrobutyricum TaxID=1519 RepID=UPI00057D64F8|nr:hypothetical protein [Clostridium tyrobutyricum]